MAWGQGMAVEASACGVQGLGLGLRTTPPPITFRAPRSLGAQRSALQIPIPKFNARSAQTLNPNHKPSTLNLNPKPEAYTLSPRTQIVGL